MACRDLNKAQLAADNIIKVTNNIKVEIEHLDTSSLKSVKEFSQRIKKKIQLHQHRLAKLSNETIAWQCLHFLGSPAVLKQLNYQT